LLKSVVTLADADDALVPVSLELAGALVNIVDLLLGFLDRVSGRCGFFLLRDQLSGIQSLKLIKALVFLIHMIDQVISLLLFFFQFLNVFFNAVRGSPSNCNFTLHYLVVLFDLL
jgi:hypothetical protein